MGQKTKTSIKTVNAAARELIKTAHGAAATIDPSTPLYVALFDLIEHVSASVQLLESLSEEE